MTGADRPQEHLFRGVGHALPGQLEYIAEEYVARDHAQADQDYQHEGVDQGWLAGHRRG